MTDETTRLLCAAAHRYAWFSTAVIREYLVEQVGTVPPSPGLDTTAVLRDAVAARTRHRLRDAVVLVLLAALAVLNPVAVVLWIVAALVGRRLLASRPRAADAGEPAAWAGALALLLVVALVKAGTGVGLPWGDHTWWPSVAITAATYAVLMADIWVGRSYLRRRFRSHNFVADHTRATSAVERRLRGLGLRRYATQLERFAAADEHSAQAAGTADLVVHRGDTPFVGAGYVVPTQSVPIVLRPAIGRTEPPDPISVSELYDRISGELVPPDAGRPRDGGIAAVLHREQLLISVVELMHQRDTEFGSRVLGDLHEPPVRHLPVDEVRAVADEQLEWARYYSCFRRESWSRNLVTSCYLHLTLQRRTLQVEVTHCVLPPVRDWLNEADEVLRIGDGPLVAGSIELLRLPLTSPKRLQASTRSLRPRRLWTRGIDRNRYGTAGSLREGVSPRKEEPHYFKKNDAFIQVNLMHNELFAVVVDYLEERGYDISELGKRAATMIESHTMTINNATFVNSDITNGAVNPPQQPAPTPAPTPTPA